MQWWKTEIGMSEISGVRLESFASAPCIVDYRTNLYTYLKEGALTKMTLLNEYDIRHGILQTFVKNYYE